MALFESLFAFGPVRTAIWRLWYPYLTRRLRSEEVVFLNYAFETDPPLALALEAGEESNRFSIQLYHHVASQIELRGLKVLEVSCGHGGGAAWITRHMQPDHYTALDLNPVGIRFCRERHQVAGLKFIEGNAQALPFADAEFDAVINVEASHCYPDFPLFLSEVSRVLRPGGHLLYADFRYCDTIEAWEKAFVDCTMELLATRDISREVLRGMDRNAKRSEALVRERLPGFLHKLGADFAGVPGARVYAALQSGDLSYRSSCMKNA